MNSLTINTFKLMYHTVIKRDCGKKHLVEMAAILDFALELEFYAIRLGSVWECIPKKNQLSTFYISNSLGLHRLWDEPHRFVICFTWKYSLLCLCMSLIPFFLELSIFYRAYLFGNVVSYSISFKMCHNAS